MAKPLLVGVAGFLHLPYRTGVLKQIINSMLIARQESAQLPVTTH